MITTVSASVTDLLLKRAGVTAAKGSPISVARMGRRHLPQFTRELGFTKGAEIGVWKGEFSAEFCEGNPGLHMLCIDPWASYPAWKDVRNELPPDEMHKRMEEVYQLACKRLAPLNCRIVRQFSADAAAAVPDRSLDFVFIDGNHVYDAVTEDLTIWMPKIKPHGFIAGHDFRVFTNKPTIHVVEAVQDFTKAHAIEPWFVLSAEPTASFLWEVR